MCVLEVLFSVSILRRLVQTFRGWWTMAAAAVPGRAIVAVSEDVRRRRIRIGVHDSADRQDTKCVHERTIRNCRKAPSAHNTRSDRGRIAYTIKYKTVCRLRRELWMNRGCFRHVVVGRYRVIAPLLLLFAFCYRRTDDSGYHGNETAVAVTTRHRHCGHTHCADPNVVGFVRELPPPWPALLLAAVARAATARRRRCGSWALAAPVFYNPSTEPPPTTAERPDDRGRTFRARPRGRRRRRRHRRRDAPVPPLRTLNSVPTRR